MVEDPAIALVLQKLLPENERDIMTAVEAAVKEALSVGITTLHVKEVRSNLQTIFKNEQPAHAGEADGHHQIALPRGPGEILQSEDYRSRAAVAFFADGAPDSKTAAFFEPYCGDPMNFGMLYYQDEELEHLMEQPTPQVFRFRFTPAAPGPRNRR